MSKIRSLIIPVVSLLTICASYGTASAFSVTVQARSGWQYGTSGSTSTYSHTQILLYNGATWVISFPVVLNSQPVSSFGTYLNAYQSLGAGSTAHAVALDGNGSVVSISSNVALPTGNWNGGIGLPGVSVPAYGSVLIEVTGNGAGGYATYVGTGEAYY